MNIQENVLNLLSKDSLVNYIDENIKLKIVSKLKNYKNLDKIPNKNYSKEVLSAIFLYKICCSDKSLKSLKIGNTKRLLFSIKNLSSLIDISEKKFSKLNKELDLSEQTSNKTNITITKTIQKYRRNTPPLELTKKRLINIFMYNYKYLKILYPDKTAIKIKEYLANIHIQLFMAGYDISYDKLEELFGEYYIYLGIILSDGRNSKDFVKIKDIYKKYYFKVYMEF